MSGAALTTLRASNAVLGRLAPKSTARRNGRLFTTPRPRAVRPWEQSVEAGAARVQLATGLSGLYWPGSGPSVLALHGWEGRATQFGPLAEHLAGSDASLLSLDGPAHGRSTGTRANPIAFARALLDADRERGPFDAVVGHSMGAASAALAIAWGLRVDRAVFIAGPASLSGVLRRFAGFVGLPDRAQRDFVAELEAVAGVPSGNVDVTSVAGLVTVPVLVFHDVEDRDVPIGDGRVIADTLPNARLIETRGLGHNKILRDPEVLAVAAEFLAG